MVGPSAGGWLAVRKYAADAPGYDLPCIAAAIHTMRVSGSGWHCVLTLTPRSPVKPGLAVATSHAELVALGLGAVLPARILDLDSLGRPTCPYPDP